MPPTRHGGSPPAAGWCFPWAGCFQDLMLFEKQADGTIRHEVVTAVMFVPMTGKAPKMPKNRSRRGPGGQVHVFSQHIRQQAPRANRPVPGDRLRFTPSIPNTRMPNRPYIEPRPIAREKRTVRAMVTILLRAHHGSKAEPARPMRRTISIRGVPAYRCPFGVDKTPAPNAHSLLQARHAEPDQSRDAICGPADAVASPHPGLVPLNHQSLQRNTPPQEHQAEHRGVEA